MYCVNPECPDLIATGVPGEYVEGVGECPVCGAPLVDELPSSAVAGAWEPPPGDGELAVEAVFETADATELEIVKTILAGADIPFAVEGMEQFSAFRGGHAAFRFNPGAGSVTLLVPEDRAEEARALLTEAAPSD